MNSKRYWKNRLPFLLTNLVCMAALTVFLLVCGNSVSAVVLILIVWALVLLTGLILTYWKRKRQMKKLLDMAKQLSERYLISEVMELPEQAEDQVYYQLLKMAGKSMLEKIGEVERERLEYKEYIEQWIHEIKTPITAMKLLCENHRTDWTKELLLELEKTNRFTEQALYYARSEHTEKDYSVREMALSQVVHQAIDVYKRQIICWLWNLRSRDITPPTFIVMRKPCILPVTLSLIHIFPFWFLWDLDTFFPMAYWQHILT